MSKGRASAQPCQGGAEALRAAEQVAACQHHDCSTEQPALPHGGRALFRQAARALASLRSAGRGNAWQRNGNGTRGTVWTWGAQQAVMALKQVPRGRKVAG